MQERDIISSLKNTNLITFVGYREYLVLNFIRDNIKLDPSIIYIFTSRAPLLISEQQTALNEIILKKLKEYVKTIKNNIKIIENRTDNLWNIQYYYRTLKNLPTDSKYIANISSGPGAYSAASMLWALETDNQISYSIELREGRKLQSAIFRNLNMKLFSYYNFKTDNLDRLIINALEQGNNTTTSIKDYLWDQKRYKTTLRNIQSHVHELCNQRILSIEGNKSYIIHFSDEFRKLGYSSSDFRR